MFKRLLLYVIACSLVSLTPFAFGGQSKSQSSSVSISNSLSDQSFTVGVNAALNQDRQEQTVYITRTGAKYHRGGCQYLRQSKIAIKKKDAIAQGYDACKVCHP